MKTRIATLGALLFTVLAIGSSGLKAQSLDIEKYFTVTDVELAEIVDGHETFAERLPIPAPTDEPGPTVPPEKGGGTVPIPTGTSIGDIIQLGTKIWEIIEKNRPVVTQNYSAVSAVPVGVKTWDELENWSEPTIKIYKLTYKNVYKMKVVEFEYRVAFTPNGTYNGKGKYLSRVEVEPKALMVAWGYKFNASGMVLNVTNVGTKDAPLAAMELNLNWSVDSVVKHMGQSVRYYIRGDGLFKNLSDGSIALGSK